jgi:hypothetical protein
MFSYVVLTSKRLLDLHAYLLTTIYVRSLHKIYFSDDMCPEIDDINDHSYTYE